uniref:Uncharacterized protein isoform X1 n=1 Tax=Nicotiana tabacum TaxID=4097 RepID=A0A1S4CUP1_TOBAC|nr:PREDICTED: uncharacterized protein LOC107822794 isoform X1 [Nicotiana tabacum]
MRTHIDEKLKALKKRYEDIIIETRKEASTRIMMWEQKALWYQRELQLAKQEALHMQQLRLQQISEAELSSLSQQRKIEELEAQLQEAEDIVYDIRVELRKVQAELERVSCNKEKDVHNLQDHDTATPGELPEENIVSLPPESQYGYVTTSNLKVANMNQNIEGYQSCHAKVNIRSPYIAGGDLSSLGLRSKAPELYQNGCTQRLPASEGNLLDREIRHENMSPKHIPNIPTDCCLRSHLTTARDNVPSEDPSETAQILSTGKAEPGMPIGFTETSDDKPGSVEATGVHNAIDEHAGLMGKMDISEQDNRSGEGLEVPAYKIDIDSVCNQLFYLKKLCNQLLNSKSTVSNLNNENPSQPLNDRVIKYTFQRKRKRDLCRVSAENASIEKNSLKKTNEGKLNNLLEPQKLTVTESSEDSGKIAEVAQQDGLNLALQGKEKKPDKMTDEEFAVTEKKAKLGSEAAQLKRR